MSLLIDTDPALGLPFADVDDALAIHALVQSGHPVAGLTTCFGNAPGPHTSAIARHLGDAYGLPVYEGATKPGQKASPAVAALVAHTGSVLALAPLTNIAAALARGAKWKQLIVLGGTTSRIPNLRPLHTTELNLALDLAAAERVLPHVDVLFPMEVCRQVLFGMDDLRGLPSWLADRCKHWVGIAPLVTKRAGFHPWDLLPALWLLQPELFVLGSGTARLHRSRWHPGRIVVEPGRGRVALQADQEAVRRHWGGLCG